MQLNRLLLIASSFLIIGCISSDVEKYMKLSIVKNIEVKSLQQATMIIENDQKFLERLFEQTRDPYYGTEKWSKECLKENIIGSIEQSSTGLNYTSTLYLDENLMAGHCSGKRYEVRFIYCHSDNILKKIVTESNLHPTLSLESLCSSK